MNETKKPTIRFRGFSGEWKQSRVGELIEDYTEKTVVQNQYPVLTSSQQQGIVRQEEYFADRQVTTNDNVGYFVLPFGYFTYRSRSDTDVFVFNRNNLIDKGIISYYYPVFAPKSCDSNFLLRRLNYGIKKQLSMAAEGTGQKVLAHSKFKDMIVDVPDEEEQIKIGTVFEYIDKLIAQHQSKLEKLQSLKASIQAFSRTNRLFGPEKPFGTIRYYRKPYTMRRNIDEAFKLYSGDKPLGLFADKLEYNLGKLNELYDEIEAIFRSAGVGNFEKLPEDHTERGQFAKLFKRFNNYLEAAKIQGFTWNKLSCEIKTETGKATVELHLDETTYLILALRYKELFSGVGTGLGGDDVPYEIDSYLTEINTGVIDANYMNSRFTKYLKALQDGTETAAVLDELHKSFATLTQEEQKYANIFLHDVQNGDVVVDDGKTLRDYITEYMTSAKNDQIHRFAEALGADETMLRDFMQLRVTEATINEFGRFDKLKATVNRDSAKVFLETLEGAAIKPFQINMKVDRILRKFILEGGFDIA